MLLILKLILIVNRGNIISWLTEVKNIMFVKYLKQRLRLYALSSLLF